MRFFSTCRSLLRGRLPGQAVIQITSRCNARCVQCGMRVDHAGARHSLDVDTVEQILRAAVRLNMQAVSFTGGEPLLDYQRLKAMIRAAKTLGLPYIRTGTNGFVFQRHEEPDFRDRMRRMADELLECGLRNLWISLDSCDPDIHEKNRGLPGVVRGMAKALPCFHQCGLFPSVNLGINRLCGGRIAALSGPFDAQAFRLGFVEAFSRYFSHAEELGFTMANCCYPMSEDDPVYAASSSDPFIRFDAAERVAMFEALREVIPRFRSRLRIFTPLSSLDALIAQARGGAEQAYACRGGVDFFFVDAHRGHAYPCGYRGAEDLGPFWALPELPRDTPSCRRCDWECFRDPSELFGPLGTILASPLAVARKFSSRPGAFTTWLTDLRYYLACGMFDGTKPPRPERLARFSQDFARPADFAATCS